MATRNSRTRDLVSRMFRESNSDIPLTFQRIPYMDSKGMLLEHSLGLEGKTTLEGELVTIDILAVR